LALLHQMLLHQHGVETPSGHCGRRPRLTKPNFTVASAALGSVLFRRVLRPLF